MNGENPNRGRYFDGRTQTVQEARDKMVAQRNTALPVKWIGGEQRADAKPTNPKDLIGSDKVPMHLWPETATVLGAMGLLDGALKYGRSNYRAIGVRASIYYDAARRHLTKWFEGQDIDPDSGLPHLAHALASLAIVIDAQVAGKLTDDRMYAGGFHDVIAEMTPHVARLKAKYADRGDVKHWTIADREAGQ